MIFVLGKFMENLNLWAPASHMISTYPVIEGALHSK